MPRTVAKTRVSAPKRLRPSLGAVRTGLTAEVVADKVHEEVRTFGGHPAVDGMAVLAIRAVP